MRQSSTAKVYTENKSCLNEEKENNGIRYNEPRQQFCHPAHVDEQQQQAEAAAATSVEQHTTEQQQQQQQKYMAGVKCILVRHAAAYSIITNSIYQVQVFCCETTHGLYVTKRETTTVITTHRAAAAAAAALCMHVEQTFRLLRRHLNHHRTKYIFYTLEQKRGKCHTKKKKNTIMPDSIHGRRGQRDSNLRVHLLRFVHDNCHINTYLYGRIHVWKKNDKKTKTAPAAGRRREHGPGRYSQGREGRAR